MLVRSFLFYVLLLSQAYGQQVVITLQEFETALNQARENDQAFQEMVLQKLQRRLQTLDANWLDGQIIQEFTIKDKVLDGGCGYTSKLNNLSGNLTVKDDSSVSLSLSALNKPLIVGLDLSAVVTANAQVRQSWGLELFGNCRKYARDSVDIDIDGRLGLRLSVELDPNPEVGENELVFRPSVSVNAALDSFSPTINVSGSILDSKLEKSVKTAIKESFTNRDVQVLALNFQERLQEDLHRTVGGDGIAIELPGLQSAQRQQILALLDIPLFTELGEILVRSHLPELLLALVNEDTSLTGEFLSDIAVCELLTTQLQTLSAQSLYALQGESCKSQQFVETKSTYFSDARCLLPVNIHQQTAVEFCEELLDSDTLGESGNNSDRNSWEIAMGSTLAVGARDLKGKKQPYRHRQIYRNVETEHGPCELEMRVFKAQPGLENQRPLVWFHGGSWTYRRDGILGLEAQIPHYTDQGFVVFVPFYRLTGQKEGSPQCHNAAGQAIISDASFALQWVQDNAASFGAGPGIKPVVVGQSAGAHLAAWLLTHRPEDIQRGLLLYPPTDFADLIQQYQAGIEPVSSQGIHALERFLRNSLASADPFDAFITENSFPAKVSQNPSIYPPIFIIHGSGDSVVPANQSRRLCASYNGNLNILPDIQFASAEYIELCGTSGRLHLIKDAEHALDICLLDIWCAAGSEEARDAVAKALEAAVLWLKES